VHKEKIEEIMEEIEQSLATVRDAEREYRALSTDERGRLPQQVRVRFEFLSG